MVLSVLLASFFSCGDDDDDDYYDTDTDKDTDLFPLTPFCSLVSPPHTL